MPEDDTGQPSSKEQLKQIISHPQLDLNAENDPNAELYNTEYAREFAEKFSGQPTAEPQLENPEVQGQPETTQDPGEPQTTPQARARDDRGRFTRKYAGKYNSPEELENAYLNQFTETQRIIGELDAVKAANLIATQQQFSTRQERPQPQPVQLKVDEQGNAFIPENAFSNLVTRDEIESTVNERLSQILEPVLKGNQALNNLKVQHPDYAENEIEFNKWLTVNPEISKKAAKSPEMGMEYAYLKFQNERRSAASQQVQQAVAQTSTQVANARQHAAPPRAARNEVAEEKSRDKREAELLEYGQRTGDMNPFKKYRLENPDVIPHWHYKTKWGT